MNDSSGRALEGVVALLFLGCWLLFLCHLAGWISLSDRLPLGLYPYYSLISVVGWFAGMTYVQHSRHVTGAPRRRAFLISFLGPLSLVFLIRSLAPTLDQRAAPLVPLWAVGVFSIFYYVPVSFRHAGRGHRPR
jgi:hypothetical protein